MIEQDFSFRKFEEKARLLVPHLLLLVLLGLNITALPFFTAGAMKPQMVLMAVYYWAIYRPTLLPPAFCFAIGLLMDVLTGMTPGINALILVLTQWGIREQRRFLMGQPYSTIWLVFGIVALASMLVQWALYGLVHMHWGPVMPALTGALVTMFLFPFVTLLLVMTHRILPVASRPFT
ncbi:MAG: rod shape-determining protein MreD [Rhodospirillales bacterium]|nr:rod shape-determining protein MreD [Rhodospirillales bacterium]MCB9996645.1 rod shape-determining protein MreD [Rhodospirillales bacterium]